MESQNVRFIIDKVYIRKPVLEWDWKWAANFQTPALALA